MTTSGLQVFEELSAFGEINEMHVCDNLGDHLIGNVYVMFYKEENAEVSAPSK